MHSILVERTTICKPKLLGRLREDSAERALGLQLLWKDTCKKDGGKVTVLTILWITLGKELGQDVSEHHQKNLHWGVRRYCQSIQAYIAEEAAHHDRALKAVQSVEKGTETLRDTLLSDLNSLSRSEQVQVYTGTEKSCQDTLTVPMLFETHADLTRCYK